jgi:CrcB protein
MTRLLMVCLGGFVGTGARFGLNGWVAHRFGETFPWGTFTVNVVGSFLAGIVLFMTSSDSPIVFSATTRQVVLAGLLGGFTTFSSFSVQTLNLVKDGEILAALANAAGSVVAGLIAVWAGDALARALFWTS